MYNCGIFQYQERQWLLNIFDDKWRKQLVYFTHLVSSISVSFEFNKNRYYQIHHLSLSFTGLKNSTPCQQLQTMASWKNQTRIHIVVDFSDVEETHFLSLWTYDRRRSKYCSLFYVEYFLHPNEPFLQTYLWWICYKCLFFPKGK